MVFFYSTLQYTKSNIHFSVQHTRFIDEIMSWKIRVLLQRNHHHYHHHIQKILFILKPPNTSAVSKHYFRFDQVVENNKWRTKITSIYAINTMICSNSILVAYKKPNFLSNQKYVSYTIHASVLMLFFSNPKKNENKCQ